MNIINLFFGSNGYVDFWEDENGEFSLCKNSDDDYWFAMIDSVLISHSFGSFEYAREILLLSSPHREIRFNDSFYWDNDGEARSLKARLA